MKKVPKTTKKVWNECLRMWNDIEIWLNLLDFLVERKDIKIIDERLTNTLKLFWMNKEGYKFVMNDCFFCHKAEEDCTKCPAVKVAPTLTEYWCEVYGQNWLDNPREFIKRLRKLDRKRRRQVK